ncbi:hypothetical protein [Niallia taxi]
MIKKFLSKSHSSVLESLERPTAIFKARKFKGEVMPDFINIK